MMAENKFDIVGTTDQPGDVAVIEINGRKFVSGLFWQPLTKPRAVMAEARKIGKDFNWDIVAIRTDVQLQAGFVKKASGAYKGMYSLAASLAGILGQSWAGAFDLGDGRYAVVAVHEGMIAPKYDKVLGHEEARELLQSAHMLFDFSPENLYSPEDFHLADRSLNLKEVLDPKLLRREYRLKQLTFGLTRREIITLGCCGLLAGLGWYGVSAIQSHREDLARREQAAEAARREARLRAMNEQSRQKVSIKALDHPWASAPSAVELLEECGRELGKLPLVVGGWSLDLATCSPQNVTVGYERLKETGGPISNFEQLSTKIFDVAPVLKLDGQAGTVGKTLNIPLGGDDELPPVDSQITAITSFFQERDVALRLEELKVEVPTPSQSSPVGGTVQYLPPDWRQFKMSFEVPYSPKRLFEGKTNWQGVRISSVVLKFNDSDSSLSWTVEGMIYGHSK